jgi:hypothetical protein
MSFSFCARGQHDHRIDFVSSDAFTSRKTSMPSTFGILMSSSRSLGSLAARCAIGAAAENEVERFGAVLHPYQAVGEIACPKARESSFLRRPHYLLPAGSRRRRTRSSKNTSRCPRDSRVWRKGVVPGRCGCCGITVLRQRTHKKARAGRAFLNSAAPSWPSAQRPFVAAGWLPCSCRELLRRPSSERAL